MNLGPPFRGTSLPCLQRPINQGAACEHTLHVQTCKVCFELHVPALITVEYDLF